MLCFTPFRNVSSCEENTVSFFAYKSGKQTLKNSHENINKWKNPLASQINHVPMPEKKCFVNFFLLCPVCIKRENIFTYVSFFASSCLLMGVWVRTVSQIGLRKIWIILSWKRVNEIKTNLLKIIYTYLIGLGGRDPRECKGNENINWKLRGGYDGHMYIQLFFSGVFQ